MALTAFALKYYLKRKSSASKSVTSPVTPSPPVTPPADPPAAPSADPAVPALLPVEANLIEVSPVDKDVTATDAEKENAAAPEKVIPVAEESAVVEAAPPPLDVDDDAVQAVADVLANKAARRPSVVISSQPIKDISSSDDAENDVKIDAIVNDVIIEENELSSTPPATSYLLNAPINADSGLTPPTPPPTPAAPSRGDEGITRPPYDPSLDLVQAAIQGRLKPRFHSTDSTAEDAEDAVIVDDKLEDDAEDDKMGEVAPDVEGGGEGDATTAVDGGVTGAVVVAAAAAAAAGKLQPICEEISATASSSTDAAAVDTVEPTPVEPALTDVPELPPKSPKSYYRRKKRNVQPELEEVKEHQLHFVSQSPSPSSSPSKEETATVDAETGSSPVPMRTPRVRRRSDRRSTGEIKIDEATVAAAVGAVPTSAAETTDTTAAPASPKTPADVEVSSGSSSGTNGESSSGVTAIGDESTSSIDFSFMSDADEVIKELDPSGSVGPTSNPVDLLEGIEDVTLDDLLHDISSMTESTTALTASMVVEVGAGAHDVDEDLAKQLDVAEDLVLDDKFFGEIPPIPPSLLDLGVEEEVPELVFNERPKRAEEEEAYDMRVSIGFTDKAGFGDAAEEAEGAAAATTDVDPVPAGVIDWSAEAEGAAGVDAEDADIDILPMADAKPEPKLMKPPPKRVIRPRREPHSSSSSASASSLSASKEEAAPPKRSPKAASTKSPPSKAPRGNAKRSGIPRPGFQP